MLVFKCMSFPYRFGCALSSEQYSDFFHFYILSSVCSFVFISFFFAIAYILHISKPTPCRSSHVYTSGRRARQRANRKRSTCSIESASFSYPFATLHRLPTQLGYKYTYIDFNVCFTPCSFHSISVSCSFTSSSSSSYSSFLLSGVFYFFFLFYTIFIYSPLSSSFFLASLDRME